MDTMLEKEIINSDIMSEILEKEEKQINVTELLNTKITYNTTNMDIEAILNSLKRGDYVLPKYQRKYVWEQSQASNLILSLIKNIPIPPIYLYYNILDGKYVILDGQQRVTTLFMYYKNIFYNGQERKKIDFKDISKKLEKVELYNEKLNDEENFDFLYDEKDKKTMNKEIKEIYLYLKNEYNLIPTNKFELDTQNITFENFDEKVKRVLMRKTLEVVFVQCDDINPNKVYTEIFKLLNSAGKELSTQEIRNGVYSDNFLYEYIDKFNEGNRIWRQIYGNSLVCKDFEFLLRFLALDEFTNCKMDNGECKIEIKNLKNFSLAKIIDDYSELFNKEYLNNKISDVSKVEIEVEKINNEIRSKANKEVEKLEKFFEKIIDIEDGRNVGGGKILILEAIFVAFSKLNLLDKDIKIEYFDLIDKLDLKKDFEIITSTSNKGNIEKRITKAIQIVKEKYKI